MVIKNQSMTNSALRTQQGLAQRKSHLQPQGGWMASTAGEMVVAHSVSGERLMKNRMTHAIAQFKRLHLQNLILDTATNRRHPSSVILYHVIKMLLLGHGYTR